MAQQSFPARRLVSGAGKPVLTWLLAIVLAVFLVSSFGSGLVLAQTGPGATGATQVSAAGEPANRVRIARVVPWFGPVAGGTVVSIVGEGFEPGASVQFGAAAATGVNVGRGGRLLQATAPAGAQGPVSIEVTSPSGAVARKAAGFQYSAEPAGCGADCGNVGDPYGGRPRPAHEQPIKACDVDIHRPGHYIVTQDIGTDPGALCLKINFPPGDVSLDLGGHTVTGQVEVWDKNNSFFTVFHGAIACNAPADDCLDYHASRGRIHHLTVSNTSVKPLANIGISSYVSSKRTAPTVQIDHVTSTVVAAPKQHRTRNIMDDGANSSNPAIASVPLEVNNNLITCSDGASACQGVELYDAPHSYVHNNRIVLPESCPECTDPARAILFDQDSNYGVATGNELVLHAENRGIRVRATKHITIAGNVFEQVRSDHRYGAVHVGETGGGIDDDFVNVFNNTFELGPGGNAVVSTAAADVYVFDNTVKCLDGDCSKIGYLGAADIEDRYPKDQHGGNIYLFNNDVSAWAMPGGSRSRAAVHACGPSTGAYDCSYSLTGSTTAIVCNSGRAVGHGQIRILYPPCPAAPAEPQPEAAEPPSPASR